MRYLAHTPSSISRMLCTLGKASVEDLFSSIPEAVRLRRKLFLPKEMDELTLKKELSPFLRPKELVSFLGAGATLHFAPEWISQQLMRAEWYTSYTPYQPEASQGTLQAIFEFQSMVASLFGLEVANGSMYDGATALVEALLMAVRIRGKNSVLLTRSIHPEYREVVKTYLKMAEIEVIEIDFSPHGITDLNAFRSMLHEMGDELSAVAIQSPNFFGRIEDIKTLALLAHEHETLVVGISTDLSSIPLISSVGHLGADIAVGEGLGCLGALNLGGPGIGLFACRRNLVRQMPGRLVGQAFDRKGQPGYCLTLSTREQHIRREKATSNICTNHNLMALALSMVLTSFGQEGFLHLSHINLRKTRLFRKLLAKLDGPTISFSGPHYNETVINFADQNLLERRVLKALEQGLIAGVSLDRFYPDMSGHLLVTTTELHEDESIRKLAHILSGATDA